jgi:hypothetical protein
MDNLEEVGRLAIESEASAGYNKIYNSTVGWRNIAIATPGSLKWPGPPIPLGVLGANHVGRCDAFRG